MSIQEGRECMLLGIRGLESVAYGVTITRLMRLKYRVEDHTDMAELFVDEQVCFYLLTSTWLVLR